MTLTFEDVEECTKKHNLGIHYGESGYMLVGGGSYRIFIKKLGWRLLPHDIASIFIDERTDSFELYIRDESYSAEVQSFVSCLNMSGYKARIVI